MQCSILFAVSTLFQLPLFAAAGSKFDSFPFEIIDSAIPESTDSIALPSMESLLIKTVFLLIFMISALICGVWLLKKMQQIGIKQPGQQHQKSIIILEKAYLSSKTSLWHATIDNTPFIIAESQHGISICQIQKNTCENRKQDEIDLQTEQL
ncbi:MAG: hypothetical protein QRY74_02305 [Chlamydia sp.]